MVMLSEAWLIGFVVTGVVLVVNVIVYWWWWRWWWRCMVDEGDLGDGRVLGDLTDIGAHFDELCR